MSVFGVRVADRGRPLDQSDDVIRYAKISADGRLDGVLLAVLAACPWLNPMVPHDVQHAFSGPSDV